MGLGDLEAFCKKLPKIELHAHLSGSISRECLHEIYLQKKSRSEELSEPYMALQDPLIAIPEGQVGFDIETFFPLFSNYIYNLCNEVSSLRYSTECVLRDFERDGVVYLELRTTPREFRDAEGQVTLTKDGYVAAVLETIENYHQDPGNSMRARLILSVDRRNTKEQAEECLDLAIRYKDRGVVALDLCGNPLKGDPEIFRDTFARAHKSGLKVTLHFAEVAQTSTDDDLLTLLSFQPHRLGHVINVSGAIREEICKRQLPLEMCISCNVHAKLITGSFEDHHFRQWWEDKRCPLILGTDDVGIFCSPISNEYSIIAQNFGLSRAELFELSAQAIDAIFADESEKQLLRELFKQYSDQHGFIFAL